MENSPGSNIEENPVEGYLHFSNNGGVAHRSKNFSSSFERPRVLSNNDSFLFLLLHTKSPFMFVQSSEEQHHHESAISERGDFLSIAIPAGHKYFFLRIEEDPALVQLKDLWRYLLMAPDLLEYCIGTVSNIVQNVVQLSVSEALNHREAEAERLASYGSSVGLPRADYLFDWLFPRKIVPLMEGKYHDFRCFVTSFDVIGLKGPADTFPQVVVNRILRDVGQRIKGAFDHFGTFYGGDEYWGVTFASPEESFKKIHKAYKKLAEIPSKIPATLFSQAGVEVNLVEVLFKNIRYQTETKRTQRDSVAIHELTADKLIQLMTDDGITIDYNNEAVLKRLLTDVVAFLKEKKPSLKEKSDASHAAKKFSTEYQANYQQNQEDRLALSVRIRLRGGGVSLQRDQYLKEMEKENAKKIVSLDRSDQIQEAQKAYIEGIYTRADQMATRACEKDVFVGGNRFYSTELARSSTAL